MTEEAPDTLRQSGQCGGAVVQPWYRNRLPPLTRWTWRLAAPPHGPGVSVSRLLPITARPCSTRPPRAQTPYADGLVATRRAGGQPDTRGAVESRGLQRGQGTPLGAMSWQASLG